MPLPQSPPISEKSERKRERYQYTFDGGDFDVFGLLLPISDATLTESGVRLEGEHIDGRFRTDGKWSLRIHNKETEEGFVRQFTLSGSPDTMKSTLSIALRKDLKKFLSGEVTESSREKFLKVLGIPYTPGSLSDPVMIRRLTAEIIIGNTWIFEGNMDDNGLFAELGIAWSGDRVVIRDQGLIDSLGFSGFFGLRLDQNPENLPLSGIGNIRYTSEGEIGNHTDIIARPGLDVIIARLVRSIPIGSREGSHLYNARGLAEFSSRAGFIVGGGIERYDPSGKGFLFDIGYGPESPLFRIGKMNALAGSENLSRTIALGGVYSEISYTPGYHIIDEDGKVYGSMGDVFQFLHRTPEMEKLMQKAEKLLREIGSTKQIVLGKDFLESLDGKKELTEFITYLEKNSAILKGSESPFQSIHFNREDFFSFRNEPVWINERLSQLHITSLGTPLSLDSIPRKKLSKNEIRSETPLTKEYGITLRSTGKLSPTDSAALDTLIRMFVRYGGIEKIRGKHITLIPDAGTESMSEFQSIISTSGKYQELILPIGTLHAIVQGLKPLIPFEMTQRDENNMQELGVYFGYDRTLLPVIKVVSDRDPLLFDSGKGEVGGYTHARGENGVLILSESYATDILDTIRSGKKEDLGFFSKRKIEGFRSLLKSSRVKNIQYISDEVKKSMQSTRESLANLSKEVGGSTLYDIRKVGKIPEGIEGYTYYALRQNIKGKDGGYFGLRLDKEGIHLHIQDEGEYTFRRPDDIDVLMIWSRYPWLRDAIYGKSGVNPRTGKIEVIPSLLKSLVN